MNIFPIDNASAAPVTTFQRNKSEGMPLDDNCLGCGDEHSVAWTFSQCTAHPLDSLMFDNHVDRQTTATKGGALHNSVGIMMQGSEVMDHDKLE